jgi:hypothetical protein
MMTMPRVTRCSFGEKRVRMYRGVPRTLYESQLDLLMEKLAVTENGCLVPKSGAARLQKYIGGEMSYATIFIFLWFKGDIAPEQEVCHTCDISGCCNENHMWAGTHQENMEDCKEKDRNWFPAGVRHSEATKEKMSISQRKAWKRAKETSFYGP